MVETARMQAKTILHVAMMLVAGSATASDPSTAKGIVVPPVTHRVGAFGPGCDFTSLQSAIDAANHRDTIRVSNDAIYPLDAVISQSLTIAGGYSSCTAENPGSAQTQIVAAGATTPITAFATAAVMNPRITLENIEISNGSALSGGGIYADGDLQLVLRDVNFSNNTASAAGGGIMLFGGVVATIEGTVEVRENTSVQGGGVHCEDASLVVADHLAIRSNTGEDVGGLSMSACELSTQTDSRLTIENNASAMHAGMSMENDSTAHVRGDLVARFNTSSFGSAINIMESSLLRVEGPYTLIHANTSEVILPAAIRVISGSSAILRSTHSHCDLDLSGTPLQDICVAIVGNTSDASFGAIFVGSNTRLELERAAVFANRAMGNGVGAHFAYASTDAVFQLENSVVFEHDASEHPVITANNGTVEVLATTFANNGTSVGLIRGSGASAFVEMHGIAEFGNAGHLLSTDSGAAAAGTCLFAEEATSTGGLGVAGTLVGTDWQDPTFATRNFRPSFTSSLLDACSDSVVTFPDRDIAGQPRPTDLSDVDNDAGAFDAGAYELAPITLFSDGFEGPATP